MKKTAIIRKDLQAKKVAVFSSKNLTIVAAWLKPGDKVKYDSNKFEDQYLDKFGEVPYKQVYYNGQEGYIVAEALA